MDKKILTLCIIHKDDQVLLGMKKRGFGEGLWNGFGGKLEIGETIEEAASREVLEEVGLKLLDLNKLGEIEFSWPGQESLGENLKEILQVHVFKSTQFDGEPVETEEMKPQWFSVSAIPFDKMWSDDIHWFDYFLNDKNFKAWFYFDENDNIINQEIILL